MAHLGLLAAGNKEPHTGSAGVHTTDHHVPWLELGNQVEGMLHKVDIHIHGDKQGTRYPHKLPVKRISNHIKLPS